MSLFKKIESECTFNTTSHMENLGENMTNLKDAETQSP